MQVSTDVRSLAEEAYVFGYPLVIMDITYGVTTNVSAPVGFKAPPNRFVHMPAFPDASFTDVVSPNADTLYSAGWLNLTEEPIVLSVPKMNRYYLIPMLDLWSNVFASPGTRTSGNEKADFVVTGPGWSGTLPAGLKHIEAPTSLVWLIGRTQTNGKSDYEAVHAIQAQYKLTPLSHWNKDVAPTAAAAVDPAIDITTPPVEQVAKLDPSAFFNRLALLMKTNPPASADAPMLAKLAQIGIVPGQPFELGKGGADFAKAVADGASAGKAKVKELGAHPGGEIVNGWIVLRHGIGSYGTNYATRAGVALFGLGANLPEDAIYPGTRVDGDGQALVGTNRYVLHFAKGQLPPVNAFWSLTMYNEKQAFVDNPLSRYAIGDRDALKSNADGSLDIHIQHDSPGNAKESNWLPAPAGPFNVLLRMYWPKDEVLTGRWSPPPVTKAAS